MATSMQDVSATAVAEASDGLQPWAGVNGGRGRVIDEWNHRSRPEGIDPCRGTYGTEGLPAMVLLAQYFGNAKRLASVATVVTQLVHGPNAFGVSYDVEALRREINRWLSLGPDQSTTLIDEILRQHRVWVMGGEEGPFAKLGEVLHHLKFFRYEKRGEETHHIVDGELIAELRRICAALTSEHSHLTGTCHIEMAFLLFFNMAVGDEELRKLLVFVFAHCLFGAVGMAVALKLLKCFRKQLSAVAFDEDLLKAREALVLALDGGVEATIAAAVAAFNSAWSAVEAEAVKAYPHEACVALQYQMQKVDLVEHMEQLREVLDVLKTAKEPVMVFVAPKGIVSCFGQKPTTLKVLRCRFDPGAITTALEGLHKLNNSQALLSNAVALLVAMGNYGTSGEVDADLMDHLRGCGKGCQLDIYALIFYGILNSALMSSIQGDIAVFVPSEGRFVVARRPGEARLAYSFEAMALDAGYERVHDFLQDARNSYDVTTMRAVRQFRREAQLFDERFVPMKDALRAEHLATMARRAARTLAGQENGGRLSRTTVVVAGTQFYDAAGHLRGSAPGAAGVFGARVSFVRGRRWSTKNAFVDLLCDEGADVIDHGLTTGSAELAAFLASSEGIDELEDRQYLCVIPNTYPAPEGWEGLFDLLRRFVSDDRCYREDAISRFLASDEASFFEWEGRKGCSVMKKRLEEVDCGDKISRLLVWRPCATDPDGNPYQIGVDPSLVRRSRRLAPEPAPAAEPTPSDEDMEEDDDDPFAEHNVPPATKPNRPRLLELYKRKFGRPAPKGSTEITLFPGNYLEWVRYKIANG